MQKTQNILCIYHKNCADGFGAALVVKQYCDKNGLEFEGHPAHYGDEPPEVFDRYVVIVDFSYPRDTLMDMHGKASHLTVIDHHKTAQEALKGLEFCTFDMTKSGAVLTWELFNPDNEPPLLLKYIQDRDLWEWKLKRSKAISAALQAMDMDFDIWMSYLNDNDIPELIVNGEAILEYQIKTVEKIANSDLPLIEIAGHTVPCINTTTLISEIGNEISKGYPFAAMYFETETDRIYSLRSADDGIDVSEIAKLFSGGGHFHAASFKVVKPDVKLVMMNFYEKQAPCKYNCESKAFEIEIRQLKTKLKELELDKIRLDWIADPVQFNGNIQLPTKCVENNLHSMRAAIDEAMAL